MLYRWGEIVRMLELSGVNRVRAFIKPCPSAAPATGFIPKFEN